MISSCTGSRSVRSGNSQNIIVEKDKEAPKSNDEDLIKDENISRFLNLVESKKVQSTDDDPDESEEETVDNEIVQSDKPDNIIDLVSDLRSKKRLPTLREQMSSMNSEQKRINNEIDIIKSDIAEIKETLNDIKDGIQIVYAKDKKTATPGPESKVNKPSKSGSTFILSEEEEVKKAPVKTKKPVRSSNNYIKKEEKAPIVQASSTSVQNDKEPESVEFYRAMDLIKRNDYINAISDLRKIISTENNPVILNNCNYWIGESNFKLKDYNEAIIYFIKVIESPVANKKDKAQVMIAECHIRTGKIPDAKKAYNNLISQYPRSEYIPRARKMLQQL